LDRDLLTLNVVSGIFGAFGTSGAFGNFGTFGTSGAFGTLGVVLFTRTLTVCFFALDIAKGLFFIFFLTSILTSLSKRKEVLLYLLLPLGEKY
jgi:hypothetical protein